MVEKSRAGIAVALYRPLVPSGVRDVDAQPAARRGGGVEQPQLTARMERPILEIAFAEQAVRVRDSKDLTRPPFTVGGAGWTPFVRFAAGLSEG